MSNFTPEQLRRMKMSLAERIIDDTGTEDEAQRCLADLILEFHTESAEMEYTDVGRANELLQATYELLTNDFETMK